MFHSLAMKGATEHKNDPKSHSFTNPVMGVIVAEVQHTTISEHDNENINIFGTV
jgi:hypothetical protein